MLYRNKNTNSLRKIERIGTDVSLYQHVGEEWEMLSSTHCVNELEAQAFLNYLCLFHTNREYVRND